MKVRPITPEELAGGEYEVGRKAGIKEVVEWVEQYKCVDEDCVKWQCFEKEEWQAKLKEWNIK